MCERYQEKLIRKLGKVKRVTQKKNKGKKFGVRKTKITFRSLHRGIFGFENILFIDKKYLHL